MGFTRLMLAARDVARPRFYTRAVRIDLAENFHLHWKNLRLHFSAGEFHRLCRWILIAYLKWLARGMPASRAPDQFIEFVRGRLPAHPDELQPDMRSQELAVELQQQADYIHIHYRQLRLEVTVEEFRTLSQVLSRAYRALEESHLVDDCPRRLGYDHESNPKRRITAGENSGGFWLGDDRPPELLTYDSMIFVDGKWQPQFRRT